MCHWGRSAQSGRAARRAAMAVAGQKQHSQSGSSWYRRRAAHVQLAALGLSRAHLRRPPTFLAATGLAAALALLVVPFLAVDAPRLVAVVFWTAGVFFAGVFLAAGGFLATGVFLAAGVCFAGAVLAAGAFLAGVLLAGVLLAGVFCRP